ncbi:MAG: hypothetical protein WBF58_07505 [Xanthobacteraceae bacterium]
MTRSELVLVMLACAGGKPYTPAQLQRAVFCASSHPCVLDDGTAFNFAGCDYGLHDPDVFTEAQALQSTGDAVITPPAIGCRAAYAASDAGLRRGRDILMEIAAPVRQCLHQFAVEVHRQPQGRYPFRRIRCCGEC